MLEKLLRSGSYGTIVGHLARHQVIFLAYFEGLGSYYNLSGPTCYPYLFKILGFDCFCTSISFLTNWSPYFSSCDGICKNRYLSFLGCIMGYSCNVTWSHPITCFAFQESNATILFSNAVFFDGLTT
jgi:hypothetical protein